MTYLNDPFAAAVKNLEKQIIQMHAIPSVVILSVEEQVRPYVEKLHRDMRDMYQRDGTDKPLPGNRSTGMLSKPKPETYHPDFQAALDAAITQAKKGEPTRVNLTNYTGSALVPSLAEKTLVVPTPRGVHLLSALRVGDQAKDITLNRLREAHAAGYIDLAEYGARQDAAMAAATEGELDLLVRDLPPPAVTPAPRSPLRYHLPVVSNVIGIIAALIAASIIPLSGTLGVILFAGCMLLAAGLIVLFFMSPK